VSDLTYAKLWHTIRWPNGWQPWGDVKAAVPGTPPSIASQVLGCASIGNDLHLVVVDDYSGTIWHTIRFPTSWQSWTNVTNSVQGSGSEHLRPRVVPCASIGRDLHLVI
jgi:hypothetical protein